MKMVEKIRDKIASFIATESFENKVNRRVASIMSKQDPFEILSKEFNGIFSSEYEHAEESLDERAQLQMKIWAAEQRDSQCFKYMCNYIMNVSGNETIKRAPITVERVQYGRAMIASVILWRNEIKRLANLYDEYLNKDKGQDFEGSKPVEY